MSRIRTNLITNRMANGAPTVSNGLIVSGVTTVTTLDLNGDLDVDGHLNADNVSIAGVVTATSFVGSGANLTSLPAQATIANNADNRVITGGSGVNLNGEANMTFNGSTLTLTPGSSAGDVTSLVLGRTSSAPAAQTTAVVTGGIPVSGVPGIFFGSTNTNLPAIGFQTPNSSNGHIVFSPKGSERLRISSDGSIVHSSTTALQLAKGTTGERPSGVDGMIRFNTTLSQTEEYRDSGWHGLSNKSTVTGGNVTTSGSYTIHTFTSSGTLEVSNAAKSGVDYLLVAGGGGGGSTRAAGGGGGGMTVTTGATIPVGTYTITVGGAGAGAVTNGNGNTSGSDGGSSSFGSIASVVGGGGGGGQGQPGRSGGSGGGGSDGQNGASGTSGQGNSGGNSTGSCGGGGGGGKGGAGGQGNDATDSGGSGGAAGASNYSGSTVNYSGGGGGGSRDNGPYGNGGGGGAGNGGQNGSNLAGNASANQGGGGGGGARYHGASAASYNGGNGGSGIVIIRYLT